MGFWLRRIYFKKITWRSLLQPSYWGFGLALGNWQSKCYHQHGNMREQPNCRCSKNVWKLQTVARSWSPSEPALWHYLRSLQKWWMDQQWILRAKRIFFRPLIYRGALDVWRIYSYELPDCYTYARETSFYGWKSLGNWTCAALYDKHLKA